MNTQSPSKQPSTYPWVKLTLASTTVAILYTCVQYACVVNDWSDPTLAGHNDLLIRTFGQAAALLGFVSAAYVAIQAWLTYTYTRHLSYNKRAIIIVILCVASALFAFHSINHTLEGVRPEILDAL